MHTAETPEHLINLMVGKINNKRKEIFGEQAKTISLEKQHDKFIVYMNDELDGIPDKHPITRVHPSREIYFILEGIYQGMCLATSD